MFSLEFMRLAAVAGVASALALSVLGVYVVLKRVVFVGLTLANVATLGAALALALRLPLELTAIVASLAAAVAFAAVATPRQIPAESVIGWGFAAASAVTVLILARTAAHADAMRLLFGNVLAISPFEAVLAAVVAAIVLVVRRTIVLPRVVGKAPVDWKPIDRRAGYVGTLDHTPNRVALERVFAQLRRAGSEDLEIRLVGRPASVGPAFAEAYPFVRYLGPLDDVALPAEAATWSLFLNPIFWLAREASMQFGQALSWGLPVLSTRSAVRGYEWTEGDVPITPDDPVAFVSRVCRILESPCTVTRLRDEAVKARDSSPSAAQVAQRLACL